MKYSSIFTNQADSTKINKIIFYNETYIILTKNEKSFKSSPTFTSRTVQIHELIYYEDK